MRLPPKKSKQKQVVIDFTSLETAKSSAPSTWEYDDWQEEGIKQEEQGERYQFGNKATRHYTNASICFSLASSLQPTDFDSRYNAARVLYQLAVDHLSPPEALEALARSIVGYREAVGVLQDGGEGTAMARIDGLFNLAQADVSLFELLDEKAIVGAPEGTAMQAAKEAKDLFIEVERSQRIEMEKVFGNSGISTPSGDEAEDDGTASTAGSERAVQAMETTIVTPQVLLDTLLESISLDMTLHSSLSHDSTSQSELLNSAKATFERAVSLRTTFMPDASPQVDVEMTLAHFSIYSSPSSPEATQLLERAISSTTDPSPALLSIYADHLVESLPITSQPLTALEPQLERALSTFQTVQSILSNRLSPPRDVPSYQIPLLLSSNLVAQSTIHLLSYHLLLSQSSSSSPDLASTHLDQAHSLALESISILKSGLSLTVSSKQPQDGSLALVRAPTSQEPRQNTSTLTALRSSYFSLVRIRLRRQSQLSSSSSSNPNEDSLLDLERKKFWPTWNALTANLRSEVELRRGDLDWWIEEIGEDKVMEVVGGEDGRNELEWWKSLRP